ncbi:MAG: DUF1592 domain-containing protein [Planctomycetaceae bacterium]
MARFREHAEPILVEYCHGCHAGAEKKGNVSLDGFTSDKALLESRDLWWRVLKNVRAGLMPPAGEPRPPDDERSALARWIKRDSFGSDPQNPDPGRVTIRRLNRTEYRNTIRDLTGVDFRADEEFPADDTGYGFDTIGDVLSVSPLLLEKYLQAAEVIVGAAVPTVPRVVAEEIVPGSKFEPVDGKLTGDKLVAHLNGKVEYKLRIATPGDYRLILELEMDDDPDFADPSRGRVVFAVDYDLLLEADVGWLSMRKMRHEFDQRLQPGEYKLMFSLTTMDGSEKQQKKNRGLRISALRVQGPLDEQHWTRTKNYDQFFTRADPPAGAEERREYARELLARFATKAFRRPVDAPTVDRLLSIAEGVYSRRGKRFEEGIAQGMIPVLASPRFIFRVEEVAPPTAGDQYGLLDEFSLASRLSYLLWSTMPDKELFELAQRGELRARLGEQVQRLLADKRAFAFIESFLGQWLQVRDVMSVPIDGKEILKREGKPFPELFVRADLRAAMQRESELFFEHIVRDDRSVLEMLDSRYTFLNERLAAHYGIPGVEGKEMRLVELPPDSPRGGVLTQGSTLLVTSNPTRTSPVKRGLFVLDNLLGTPAPPPPEPVAQLEAVEKEFKGREPTLREVMELHRSKPICQACHARMDPLGFGLENFNALGMWRDSERGQPIETEGRLITGESFQTVRELKRILVEKRRSDFYRCLTEKLLTYALGRGIEYYDVETVDQIVDRLEREQGRFSALLLGIVESAPFQKRRNAPR